MKHAPRLALCWTLVLSLVVCQPRTTPQVPVTAAPQTTAIPVAPDALVIVNGTVIDGTGAPPAPHRIVVIEGDRIVGVGGVADFALPAGVTQIDAGGRTVLAGIINTHAHFFVARTPDPATDTRLRRQFLVKGVTAVCDLHVPLDAMKLFKRARDTEGPVARGFQAGPVIAPPGGHPGRNSEARLNDEVRGPAEARAAVDDLLNRGADVIKIALEPGVNPRFPWPTLSLEEVRAVVAAAHARGVVVRAHVQKATMLGLALDGGVDVIEHVPVPWTMEKMRFPYIPHSVPTPDLDIEKLLQDVAHPALPVELEAQLTRMVQQRVILVPTLTAFVGHVKRATFDIKVAQLVINFHLAVVRRFHALGGVAALGNDYAPDRLHAEAGMPLEELELLLSAGLTPMEVIEAGTRHAAKVCGHSAELGTLEPGKVADVIIVDGDPLTDMHALNRVITVIKGGEIAYTAM